eukprot:TRINITY_DN35741_c0_g1_i1.p1 TRINITY_DN35741_c0_g1~~TRINITY_DN35741_c0_g1_i1.p1  ORF type:complete len:217 (+),score=52.38 TRINITY_DN35741_c0_g1_i1:110-760(+)
METVEHNIDVVDVLPTQEIAMTLSIMRNLAVKSLRSVSGLLNSLAERLDVEEEKGDSDEKPLVSVESDLREANTSRSENLAQVSSRLRNDSLLSVDSGFLEDCELTSGTDPATGLEVISLDEVSYHCTMGGVGGVVIYDKVYDVTEYLERGSHPGGEDVMMEFLGYDATMAFRGWDTLGGLCASWRNMWWESCLWMSGSNFRPVFLVNVCLCLVPD